MAVHLACGKTWTGNSAQHCPACCVTFSSESAGNMHRVGDFNLPKGAEGARRCKTPEEIGLVERYRGGPIWGMPGPDQDINDSLSELWSANG